MNTLGETDCGVERGETGRKEITCHLHFIGPILTRPPLERNALWKWREAVNLLLHTMTLFCESCLSYPGGLLPAPR